MPGRASREKPKAIPTGVSAQTVTDISGRGTVLWRSPRGEPSAGLACTVGRGLRGRRCVTGYAGRSGEAVPQVVVLPAYRLGGRVARWYTYSVNQPGGSVSERSDEVR